MRKAPSSSSSTGSAASASQRSSRRSRPRRGPAARSSSSSIPARSNPRRAASWPRSRTRRAATSRPPTMPRRRLASLGDRVVLVLDRYEVLRPIDLWLLQTFVPALARATRRRPRRPRGPARRAGRSSMGRLFRGLPLGNLPREDAEPLLRHEGVDGDDLERINRLARGHPLSLRLAAAALVAGPELDHEATTVTAIVEELTELYLARSRSADAPGPRRGLGRPAADALAPGRDAARRRAAGRVRAAAGPAVRRAQR